MAGLTFDLNLSIMDDNLLLPGTHDGAADRHLLDLNTHYMVVSSSHVAGTTFRRIRGLTPR
jgi:hypothetical protein